MNILTNTVSFSHKIKRSEFITNLAYVTTIQQAKEFIHTISKANPQANHNCWAYIIGDNQQSFHSSDNGEPSGTAGKPMLNALFKNNVTNVACVVTRYFGGVKLGVRGLIEAYESSVDLAIKTTKLQKLVNYMQNSLSCEYSFLDTLKYKLENLNAEIINTEYTSDVFIKIKYEEQYQNNIKNILQQLYNSKKIKNLS